MYQVLASGQWSNTVMSHIPQPTLRNALAFRMYISTKKQNNNKEHIVPIGTSPPYNPARPPQGRLYRDLPNACAKKPRHPATYPRGQTPPRALSAPYCALRRARSVVRRAPDRPSLCAVRLPQTRWPSARLSPRERAGVVRGRH